MLSERSTREDPRRALERERGEIGKRIARLVAAIEQGGEVASLVATLPALEARKAALADELIALPPIPRARTGNQGDRLRHQRID